MLKLLSLFSGIGAPEQALKNIGVQFELIAFCEIDKYATMSYCAVHGVDDSLNLGDITKIDVPSLPTDIDLITHGSPCTDFSIAGKGAGGDIGSGTRSSLMWNTVDIVRHCKPKYVLWENVKNLLSAKHRHNFDSYLDVMNELGYNNYYKVLNAKDYGIPQNRERIFTISIRKDIDNGSFKFPDPVELKLRLKDMLDQDVDDKYYLPQSKVEKITLHQDIRTGLLANQGTEYQHDTDVASTLLARDHKGFGNQPMNCLIEAKRIGGIFDNEKSKHQAGSIWDKEQLAPTLDTMQGGWRQPSIIEDADHVKLSIIPHIEGVKPFG